jgi:hypothetical protein
VLGGQFCSLLASDVLGSTFASLPDFLFTKQITEAYNKFLGVYRYFVRCRFLRFSPVSQLHVSIVDKSPPVNLCRPAAYFNDCRR